MLSCRVLGKGIEDAFLSYVLNMLRKEGVQRIFASYLPTVKNVQVADYYDRIGFTLVDTKDNCKYYEFPLYEELSIKPYFKIGVK